MAWYFKLLAYLFWITGIWLDVIWNPGIFSISQSTIYSMNGVKRTEIIKSFYTCYLTYLFYCYALRHFSVPTPGKTCTMSLSCCHMTLWGIINMGVDVGIFDIDVYTKWFQWRQLTSNHTFIIHFLPDIFIFLLHTKLLQSFHFKNCVYHASALMSYDTLGNV